MHEYRTARTIFGFMEFVSWALVVIGVIVFLAGMSGGASMSRSFGGSSLGALTGALPGIFLTIVGIMCVMLVQVGRATVDTAEMTGKLLKNSNEELKLLKSQGARVAPDARPAGAAKTGPSRDSPASHEASNLGETNPSVVKHRGQRIDVAVDGVFVGRERFASIDDAKVHIDRMPPAPGSPVAPKSLGERIEPTMSSEPSAKQHVHNGKTIRETETGAFVGMMRFDDLDGAREFIDQKLIPSERASKS